MPTPAPALSPRYDTWPPLHPALCLAQRFHSAAARPANANAPPTALPCCYVTPALSSPALCLPHSAPPPPNDTKSLPTPPLA